MAEPEIQKGLAGVTVDTTAISKVMPETNSLTYRGYAVQDLCAHASFEEVAWLMWNGDLPTAAQLDELRAEEVAAGAKSPRTMSPSSGAFRATPIRWTR